MTATIHALLAPVKARAEAATEGPWEFDGVNVVQANGEYADVTPCEVECMSYCYGGSVKRMGEADAAFIAHARQDVPRLVAALEAAAEVHRPFEWDFGFGPVTSCKGCADQGASEEAAHYPCPTVTAVVAALGDGQ